MEKHSGSDQECDGNKVSVENEIDTTKNDNPEEAFVPSMVTAHQASLNASAAAQPEPAPAEERIQPCSNTRCGISVTHTHGTNITVTSTNTLCRSSTKTKTTNSQKTTQQRRKVGHRPWTKRRPAGKKVAKPSRLDNIDPSVGKPSVQRMFDLMANTNLVRPAQMSPPRNNLLQTVRNQELEDRFGPFHRAFAAFDLSNRSPIPEERLAQAAVNEVQAPQGLRSDSGFFEEQVMPDSQQVIPQEQRPQMMEIDASQLERFEPPPPFEEVTFFHEVYELATARVTIHSPLHVAIVNEPPVCGFARVVRQDVPENAENISGSNDGQGPQAMDQELSEEEKRVLCSIDIRDITIPLNTLLNLQDPHYSREQNHNSCLPSTDNASEEPVASTSAPTPPSSSPSSTSSLSSATSSSLSTSSSTSSLSSISSEFDKDVEPDSSLNPAEDTPADLPEDASDSNIPYDLENDVPVAEDEEMESSEANVAQPQNEDPALQDAPFPNQPDGNNKSCASKSYEQLVSELLQISDDEKKDE